MSTTQTLTRLPLPRAWHVTVPVGSADVLPRLAAARWPDRTALLDGAGPITFAELDRRISRLASGLRELLGGEDSVVAVSAVPGVEFAVAYYAVLRSGNLVAPVHPRLGAVVLDRLLVAVQARAVVLARSTYDRARAALARHRRLEHVLLLDAPAAGPGPMTCAELAQRGDLLVDPRDRDENEPAVIMFGPRGAGYAKAAGRSHQSLKIAAVRTGARHGLSEQAVALSALPTYHLDHLNAAVWAGATQVFCASPDPAVLADEVRRHGASHCFSLPGRTDRLAVAS